MFRSLTLALLTLVAGWAVPALAEQDPAPAMIVKIHADWCGTCRALEPTWSALEDEPRARLVVLDVSDKDRLASAQQTAKSLGIESFFDAHKGKTGTVGVIDAQTREAVAVYKGELDPAVYRAAIDDIANAPGA